MNADASQGGPPPLDRPAPVPQVPFAPPWCAPPRKHSTLKRILITVVVLLLVMSTMMNVYLLALIGMGMESRLSKTVLRAGERNQTVAVYEISGVLDGKAAGAFDEFCRQVLDDGNIRAVVLRVESPGGALAPSDQIHRGVEALRAHGKTVVVSMGGVAASGGYYVSAPADEIFAEPTTATGSIGVIATWPVLQGTLEKIGVEMVVMKSAHAEGWKDSISPFHKPDERQRRHVQALLDDAQARFEDIVRKGRGDRLKERPARYEIPAPGGDGTKTVLHEETEPFNGKVYTANEAKERGLIDAIGYQSDAIDRTVELADLDRPNVVRYAPRVGLMAQLLSARAPAPLGLDAQTVETLQTPRLMMIWKVD